VRLGIENGNLELEVQDNGIGADQERLSAPQSLGIVGMRERALLLRGDSITGKPKGYARQDPHSAGSSTLPIDK
jgi:signal transduction histidine kinase